jgi:hypothetical protein
MLVIKLDQFFPENPSLVVEAFVLLAFLVMLPLLRLYVLQPSLNILDFLLNFVHNFFGISLSPLSMGLLLILALWSSGFLVALPLLLLHSRLGKLLLIATLFMRGLLHCS